MKFGMCVCRDPRGKQADLFTWKLTSKFRQFFKKGTAARCNLNLNMVVLKFDEVAKSESSPHSSFFYHLGYCNLKTWIFTLLPLALDSRLPSCPGALPLRLPSSDDSEHPLDPLDHVVLAIHAFATFDLTVSWSCQICTLIRSRERFAEVQNMHPEHVEIFCDGQVACSTGPHADKFFFWRGWENEKPARPSRSSKPQQSNRTKGNSSRQRDVAPPAGNHDIGADRAAEKDDDDMGDDDHGIEDEFEQPQSEPDDFPDDVSLAYSASIAPTDLLEDQNNLDVDFEGEANPWVRAAEGWLDQGEADGLFNVPVGELEEDAVDLAPPNLAPQEAPQELPVVHSALPDVPSVEQAEGEPIAPGDAKSIATSDVSISDMSDFNPAHSDHSSDDSNSSSSSSSSSSEADAEPKVRADPTADERIEYRNGSIRYNYKTCNLVAHCSIHPKNCRKTRTAKPGRNSGQGRPIGFLAAWLDAAEAHEDGRAHNSQCQPSLEDRQKARAHFKQLPGAANLLQFERQQEAGEPEEPVNLT